MNILKLAASKIKCITNNHDIIKHPFNDLNTFISMIQCFSGKCKFQKKSQNFRIEIAQLLLPVLGSTCLYILMGVVYY